MEAATTAQAVAMVRAACARHALAPLARTLRDLDQRDHVAADSGFHRDSLLSAIPTEVSDRGRPGPGRGARRVAVLGRVGVLSPRASTARRRRKIRAQHDGQFPASIEQLRDLPGIGRYTAGAILSIALDQRHPVVEANTIRVLSRLLAYSGDPMSRDGQERLWAFAAVLLPRRRVGDFNQAMMELGSTICTPRQPACERCPLAVLCPTNAHGLQGRIPRRKQKTKYVAVREAAVVVQVDGKILLRRCQSGERWEGLWDFPRFPVTAVRGKKLEAELVRRTADLTGLTVTLHGRLATIRHGVTRYRITLSCHLASYRTPGHLPRHLDLVTLDQAARYPLSVTGRKICQLLGEQNT